MSDEYRCQQCDNRIAAAEVDVVLAGDKRAVVVRRVPFCLHSGGVVWEMYRVDASAPRWKPIPSGHGVGGDREG